MTTFGGRTAKGIGHGESRDRVEELYGTPSRTTSTNLLVYPGVLCFLDAQNRVNKMVLNESRASTSSGEQTK